MNRLLTIISFSIILLMVTASVKAQNTVYSVGFQTTVKQVLEGFKGDPFYGAGIRGEWFPYGNVGVTVGVNYYNSVSVDGKTRLEKNRNDVSPSFYLAALNTTYSRYNFEASTKLYLFNMEYDDKLASYALLGFSVDYVGIINDIGAYNATDYRFATNLNGTSTRPTEEESVLGLYFNLGAGVQYQIGLLTIFAEGKFAMVGSRFNADDKQYTLKRNANASIGVSYRFSKKRR